MDTKNDLVWEEAVARVVTVESEVGTKEGPETLATNIVCYEGYFATKWNLKSGGPKAGVRPKSIGFETLQAKLPSGGMLDLNLFKLCDQALLMDINELPLKVRRSRLNVVAPELSLYCSFPFNRRPDVPRIYIGKRWVTYPYIVALEELPLRSLASRSDMGSSEMSANYGSLWYRWERYMRRSNWKSDKKCWGGNSGGCNETMTNYCGRKP